MYIMLPETLSGFHYIASTLLGNTKYHALPEQTQD